MNVFVWVGSVLGIAFFVLIYLRILAGVIIQAYFEQKFNHMQRMLKLSPSSDPAFRGIPGSALN